MSNEIELNVNGVSHRLEETREPLLLVLRNTLGHRSTRHGCATGNCGACHVLLNGRPVAACITPLDAISGATVETIESLATDVTGRAVIDAMLTVQAGQCGYCLAGIVVAATALLRKATAVPSRTEIATALDGHLCRCGAHARILDAIENAAGKTVTSNGAAA